MQWISVNERLPEDLKEVLYCASLSNGVSREIMTGHRIKGEWAHCCLFYSTMILKDEVKVTHWMEFPDYPKKEPCQHKTKEKIYLDGLGYIGRCNECHLAFKLEE